MLRILIAAGLLSVASLSSIFLQEQELEPKRAVTQERDDKVVIPGNDDNAIARRDFMRTKLMFSQNIFKGLTTGDFAMIDAGIKEVKGITHAAKWVEIDDDVYRKLTADFNTTIKRLESAAKSKNIDAIALRYYQMSTSCIDCHAHIRVADYEF